VSFNELYLPIKFVPIILKHPIYNIFSNEDGGSKCLISVEIHITCEEQGEPHYFICQNLKSNTHFEGTVSVQMLSVGQPSFMDRGYCIFHSISSSTFPAHHSPPPAFPKGQVV
jgi:hypothetical protein